jgi:integrase/recombinase XerD
VDFAMWRCANLHIKDVHMDRKQLHIRQGKGRKDRYVPLCDLRIRGIQIYLSGDLPFCCPKKGNHR